MRRANLEAGAPIRDCRDLLAEALGDTLHLAGQRLGDL
jgi:hypothetical protein